MLLYFHSAGQTNYAKEAVYLLGMVNAAANPKVAAQIMYSRFINTTGKKGEISLLICIINKAVKDFVATTGANVCLEVIIQCGKSLNNVQDTLYRFDGAPPSCFIFNTFESM
jgi:hypothetical protein